jgi:hypothetical protein
MRMTMTSRSVWLRLCSALAALTLLLVPTVTAGADELLPDIASLPPTDLSIDITDDGRHLLRFTQTFANVGAGPLRVRGVLQPDGSVLGYQEIMDSNGQVSRSVRATSVIFHPHHKHWHADDVASYELRQAAPWGPTVAKNGKVSYCWVDNGRLASYVGGPTSPRYLNCLTDSMGLSAGWTDEYHADLPDQWVEVTQLKDGVYWLVIVGDPNRLYLEADSGAPVNNTSWAKVELTGNRRQVRIMAEDEVVLRVNGERQTMAAYPRVVDGRALTHVRLAEQLGARVDWDGTHALISRDDSLQVTITPGKRIALVNGQPVDMGAEAITAEGRILVPVRFLVEQLGATVQYDWLTASLDVLQ